MTEDDVRRNAFAMPINNPAYPPGPYRFVDREYLIISYRTDPAVLQQLIPAPLQLIEPVVRFEFINMPDSTGFGHYCEAGQSEWPRRRLCSQLVFERPSTDCGRTRIVGFS